LIHGFDVLAQHGFVGVGREGNVGGTDSQSLTHSDLGVHIDVRCGVVTDDDHSKVRLNVALLEAHNPLKEFALDFGCASLPVHTLGCHGCVTDGVFLSVRFAITAAF
jgi:hypothetical protein